MAARQLRPLLVLGLAFGLTSTAFADRPKIAVLGLEVQTNGATADPESTKIAKWLTQGLRNRATAGRGQYQLAPNSARELIDEKLVKDCMSEKLDCMVPIGTEMQTEFLLFGRIDKMIKNDVSVFQVSLKLIDVKNRKELPPYKDFVPVNTAKSQDQALTWAGEAYAAITREARDKEPVVLAPKDPGPKESKDIVEPKPNPAQPKEGNGWKTATKIGLATTGVMAVGFAVSAGIPALKGWSGRNIGQDCKTDPMTGNVVTGGFACQHGDLLAAGTWTFGIGFVAAAGFTGIAYWMSSRSGGKESPTQTSSTTGSRVKKQRTFVVTPVVAPDGAGATVRFDW